MSDRLEAFSLRKRFGKRWVVRDVSLSLDTGQVVGLLGPNGAGKTTVFGMILGLVGIDGGEVHVNGSPVHRLPVFRRARLGMGYLPQEPSAFQGLSVAKNILSILEIQKNSRSWRLEKLAKLLEQFNLVHLATASAQTLSGGERRRLEIARAMGCSPRFLLFDEPFAGVDPIAVADLQQMIRRVAEDGVGVLITDHSVRETLSISDAAYIINDGLVLASGTAAEIMRNRDVKRIYLGEGFAM